VQRIYACLRLADLLLPDTTMAEPHLQDAQRLSSSLNLPAISYRLRSRRGHLCLLQGRDLEAQAYLEAAEAQIEALRGNLVQEAIRASFLRDKTAVYEDLITLHLERSDVGSIRRAFAVAERAKSRTLVDLLTGVILPDRTPSDDPALATHLRTLQADLSATYNKFLDASTGSGDADWLEMQARADKLEQEISLLRLRAASRPIAPDPFAIPFSLDSLQAQLPADLILLAYHIVGDEILAFVYWQGEVLVIRNLSRTPVIQNLLQRLNTQWDRFRAGHDFAQRHMTTLEKSTQRILAALYSELVAPLELQLTSHVSSSEVAPTRLAIVPHGLLHQVPFHALYDGQGYLIDRFEISYAPSATVLALCQQRPRRGLKRGLVVGVADALIPTTNAEIQVVVQQLTDAGAHADALTGEHAQLATFNAAAPGYDVLHLACHGLFRADNPMFSALKLHDGWLTAADAMQLDLENALVTLSACESGRATVILGDEVVGLPRAFLSAGAATVLVSLWIVQDETTATLMAHWYQGLRERMGPAAALRAAQQALKARYSHPYYWAPFVLIGQR
jgi:CHAT domain-containing protein